jgi:hypothetical protein
MLLFRISLIIFLKKLMSNKILIVIILFLCSFTVFFSLMSRKQEELDYHAFFSRMNWLHPPPPNPTFYPSSYYG